jgi:predicted RecA/RadA family phage recombinase
MRNQTQNGDSCYIVAPTGGFVSGNGYLIGAALFGVAGFTCAAGATGVLWLKGQYTLPKLSAQAWTVGQQVFWDNTNFWCTNVVNGNRAIGVAVAVEANPSATGEVRLNGFTVLGASV